MKSQDRPQGGGRSQRFSRRQRGHSGKGEKPLRTRKWEGPGEEGREEGRGVKSQGEAVGIKGGGHASF